MASAATQPRHYRADRDIQGFGYFFIRKFFNIRQQHDFAVLFGNLFKRLQDIFIAKPPEEASAAAGRTLSLLTPLACTGLKPHFLEKMAASGVALPPTFFEREDVIARPAFAAGYGR